MTEQSAHANMNAKDAYDSVPPEDKKRAFCLLAAAGATFALLLLSRLVWLFEPLLDLIYYGTLSEIIYYIILGALFTVYTVLLNRYLVKRTDEHIFLPKKERLGFVRALGVIAVGTVAVFIAGAAFGFKLKIEVEMGRGVTMATALTNIAVYFYYAFHLWLGLTCAELVQRALKILLPAKYTLPWGAIFLVAVFGVIELILELAATPHMFPWMYFLFTFAYAAIYVITDGSYHLTYWASVIIMVL